MDPALAQRTFVALDRQERVMTGARAVLTVAGKTGGITGAVRRVLALRPVSLLLEPAYRLFARHRGRFARFFKDPE